MIGSAGSTGGSTTWASHASGESDCFWSDAIGSVPCDGVEVVACTGLNSQAEDLSAGNAVDDKKAYGENQKREAAANVQEYQNPFQFRAAGHRRRDSGGVASVREKNQRVQQAVEGERGIFHGGGGRDRGDLAAAAGFA